MIDLCVGTLIMSAIPVSSAAGNASGHDVDAAYFNYPAYEGNDLELDIADGTARFRLWSPEAKEVRLRIYADARGGNPLQEISMTKAAQGTCGCRKPRESGLKRSVSTAIVRQ